MFEGVLTVSHTRQILESAGFFYIRTTNNDSKATGKIGISIPTNTINNEMQTFSLFTDSVPQAWLLSGDSIGYPDPDALDSLYYYIEFINDYEWINCDDFIEGPQSDFTVNIYKNPTLYYTNVYFIFDEINSITEFSHYSQDVFKHYMLPVGYTGKLFAIAYYDGQGHYYLEEMTIPE
ncbi:MAG: hypothetical protein C0596_11330 [Marinilabiliales bacterium]|nr:MAG: hypothetical protein C0596_11330 [Marinilabiliales bacterium]